MKKFSYPLQAKPQVYLTKQDLTAISSLDGLPPLEDLHRKLFLLQCELGFRIPIKNCGIQNDCITLKDIKTGVSYFIKLSPEAQELLKQLNNQIPSVYLPRYNLSIRKICEKAGLNKIYTQDLVFRKKCFYKYELITSHTARRTAIINMLRTGVSVSDILRFTGLRQIQLLSDYLKNEGIYPNFNEFIKRNRNKYKNKPLNKAKKLLRGFSKKRKQIKIITNFIIMNKNRRKEIAKIKTELDSLKGQIEEIRDQEQDAYDNLPGSIQEGEKGEKMSEAIDNLDSAVSSLEEIEDYLQEAMN